MTLEQIINKERTYRNETGLFGLDECKKAIQQEMKLFNKSLYQLLEEYVEKANNDIFFNKAMVLACWELINKIN